MQTSMRLVAGVDEAGRGPLAGPVVACAAVVLPQFGRANLRTLKDSKHLSGKQREEYYGVFRKHPGIQWGIGRVSERVIDRINIHRATKLAMVRAVNSLQKKLGDNLPVASLVIDGNFTIPHALPQTAVVRGDETVPLCSLASIVAKVTRDRLMGRYHRRYPYYGFDRHKGYGTRLHLAALRRKGPCKYHRMSFAPLSFL